jgi:hypothetical protein
MENRHRRRGEQQDSRSTLGELKSKYKPVTRRMVLECGGNGRAQFSPPARGNQWTNGGAGCAEWTGVALADVLKAAGLKARRSSPRITAPTASSATPARTHFRAACDREGDGSEQSDRVGDERQAAAQHPWRAGAADRSGLAGSAVAEMAHAHQHPRQGA